MTSGKIRSWETSTKPQLFQISDAHLFGAQTREFVESDPTGERLGPLAEQIRRRAAEDEETRRSPWPIGKDPKNGEKIGAAVYLVEYDQPAETLQGQGRLIQSCQIPRVLQIEESGGSLAPPDDLSRQRRLPDLAGAEYRDYRAFPDQAFDRPEVPHPRDVFHALKFEAYRFTFQGRISERAGSTWTRVS
jgi:hypothetical protein